MTTSKEALQNSLDAEPHYVIHVGTGWHSERYPSRFAAQAWIDGYGVTQSYKDANYRVVNATEYEHGGDLIFPRYCSNNCGRVLYKRSEATRVTITQAGRSWQDWECKDGCTRQRAVDPGPAL